MIGQSSFKPKKLKVRFGACVFPVRKLLEGEESRLNVAAGPTSISGYSQKVSYAAPSYGRTSYLLSSRFHTLEEMLTASRALEAEASPPQEENKDDVEEDEEGVEDKEEKKDDGECGDSLNPHVQRGKTNSFFSHQQVGRRSQRRMKKIKEEKRRLKRKMENQQIKMHLKSLLAPADRHHLTSCHSHCLCIMWCETQCSQ